MNKKLPELKYYQEKYGRTKVQELADKLEFTQDQVIRALDNIKDLDEFFNWVNCDIFIGHVLNGDIKLDEDISNEKLRETIIFEEGVSKISKNKEINNDF